MSKTSRIGLLWDSVSDNMGDQAIGLVLQRALKAHRLPTQVIEPFTRIHHEIAMLVIGGGELIRTPGDPFYDAFRVPGKHILNTVGVLDGSETDYLADYRLVTSRSLNDQAKLSRGEVYPDLTLMFGEYAPSAPLVVDIPEGALGIHVMPSRPEEGLALANWLRKADLGPIVWMPITHYANDEALMRVLVEHVPGSVLLPRLSADDIFSVIGRLQLLVTSSLHGTLFAYAQDVPFISIPRYPKLGHFLSQRRLDAHLVQTADDLQTLLPRWLNHPPSMNTARAQDQMRCRELVDLICAHADKALSHSDPDSFISLPPTNRPLHEMRMHYGYAEGNYIADCISHRIMLQSRDDEIKHLRKSIGDCQQTIGNRKAEIASRDDGLKQQQSIHSTAIAMDSSQTSAARQFLRGAGNSLIRRRQSKLRTEASPQLIFSIETELAEPIYVGKGAAFPLQGWCYSQWGRISKLEILADGTPHRVAAHSRARMDVFNNQSPAFDQSGNSLMSGFYAVVPFQAIDTPTHVNLGLRATLEDGSVVEDSIGSLELKPGPGVQPREAKWSARTGRIALCMATYNPQHDLFIRQIESIQKQTHSNWVCVISDDASSAEARSEISKAIQGDARFILVENEIHVGFYRNFERCLQLAPSNADFIALSDHDDVWFADKLESLLAEFQDDTQLVYSDMQLIDRADQVLSNTFWITRKNNYEDLSTLLFANTITGAASMFRASLLPVLLPFPERVIDAYHDHWLGLTALVRGKIRFINRPLYAYRQHDANVIGHRNEQPYPGICQGLKALAKAGHDRMQLQTIGRSILESAVQNYQFIIHKVVLAKTLLMRQPDMSPSKKRCLRRITRFEHSLLPVIGESVRSALGRRPSLGLERYHLRIALGVRLWDMYFRSQKDRLLHTQLQRAQAAAPSVAPSSALMKEHRHGLPVIQALRYGNTQWILRNISPLTLDVSARYPRRVNLLMATIDFQYVYGGYIGMFNLALKLKREGYKTRIILTEKSDFDIEKWRHQARYYPGLTELFNEIEILYRYDRSLLVEANPKDAFVATSCWTAHIAHQAMRMLKRERFTFLIQDYEPVFVAMNSIHAIFMEAYTFPQYNLFSTELLREYFCRNHVGIYAGSADEGDALSISFQNAINRFSAKLETIQRDNKKLLFYARPEPHAARNLFELGIMSLVELLHSGGFDIKRWTFHGIGSLDLKMQFELAHGVHLKLMPRISLQEYIKLLPTFDAGLSLMLTPHPSLVPLEMASAGLWTVTNTFANKTADKLQAISRNLIAVPPTIDGITEGLLQAILRADDYEQRIAGAQVNWATNWEESYNSQVMDKLRHFID